jgi:hypothetical protein
MTQNVPKISEQTLKRENSIINLKHCGIMSRLSIAQPEKFPWNAAKISDKFPLDN